MDIHRSVEQYGAAGKEQLNDFGDSDFTMGDLLEIHECYLATGTPATWDGDDQMFLAPDSSDDLPETRIDPRNAVVEIYGAPVRRYPPQLRVFRGGRV